MEDELNALIRLALGQDGLFLGVSAAFFAARTWIQYRNASKAVKQLQETPCTNISDLPKLLKEEDLKYGVERSPESQGTSAILSPSNWREVFSLNNGTGPSHGTASRQNDSLRDNRHHHSALKSKEDNSIGGNSGSQVAVKSNSVLEPLFRSRLWIFGKHGVKEMQESLPKENRRQNPNQTGQKLVIVRGKVQPMVDRIRSKSLIQPIRTVNSPDRAVILEKSQMYVFTEMSSLFGWMTQKEQVTMTRAEIPFVLAQGKWPSENHCVVVSFEGLRHPLPLQRVYSRMESAEISWNTAALRGLLGQPLPVGVLNEEKMLKVGTDITAIGTLDMFGDFPMIKASKKMPFFLTGFTREELITLSAHQCKWLFWGSVVFTTFAVGALTYSCVKIWQRWKERQRNRGQNLGNVTEAQLRNAAALVDDDGTEDGNIFVRDGELCVVCLTRSRRAVFVHCGHRVCCCYCARCIQQSTAPRCPICREGVTSVYRVFDS